LYCTVPDHAGRYTSYAARHAARRAAATSRPRVALRGPTVASRRGYVVCPPVFQWLWQAYVGRTHCCRNEGGQWSDGHLAALYRRPRSAPPETPLRRPSRRLAKLCLTSAVSSVSQLCPAALVTWNSQLGTSGTEERRDCPLAPVALSGLRRGHGFATVECGRGPLLVNARC
jgi:hypothetical protein